MAGGACMVGVCGRGKGACIIGGRACVAGACMAGGMYDRGACMAGGMHGWGMCDKGGGACVAGETAIAADSTHPTGMHSCFILTNKTTATKENFTLPIQERSSI